MSADDDSFEERPARPAAQAYQNVLLRKAAVMVLSMAALAALTLGDWAWGVLALWHVSSLVAAFLAGLILGELVFLGWHLTQRGERQPRRAGLSDGEKMTAALDRLAAARDRPEVPPWWRAGLRARVFWQGLVTRAVYSSCCGLVVASRAGVPAGIGAAVAWTALSAFLGSRSRAAAAGTIRAAAFADPRPPRDTPET